MGYGGLNSPDQRVGVIEGVKMTFKEYIKVRREKFGSVIFETLTEKVFVTNHIGSDILTLIEEGKNADEINKSLETKYSANSQTIQQETSTFINDLREKGVLA